MVVGSTRSGMAQKQFEALAAYQAMVRERDASRKIPPGFRRDEQLLQEPSMLPRGEYNSFFKRREPFSGYLQYRHGYPRLEEEMKRDRDAEFWLAKDRETLRLQRLEAEAFDRTRAR